MKRYLILTMLTVAALTWGVAVSVSSTVAQTAKDLMGTWTFVSNISEQDSKKYEPFPNGKGILIFGNDGHYALVNLRSDLPKFASGNRTQGTPDENKAVVQGSITHYGTYTVDENGKILVLRIEASTFPNWNGVEQRRPFTVTGDELKYTVPAASAGGFAQVTWKRVK